MAHGTFDSGWGAYAWWVSRKVHGKSTVDLPLVGRLRKILPVPVPVPICRFAGAGAGADWRFAGAVFFEGSKFRCRLGETFTGAGQFCR